MKYSTHNILKARYFLQLSVHISLKVDNNDSFRNEETITI